jgi:hypothetical protein
MASDEKSARGSADQAEHAAALLRLAEAWILR